LEVFDGELLKGFLGLLELVGDGDVFIVEVLGFISEILYDFFVEV
jgi:hypothetical protein